MRGQGLRGRGKHGWWSREPITEKSSLISFLEMRLFQWVVHDQNCKIMVIVIGKNRNIFI
jgi:hypothetical protein